jgi:hypothetical protein
MNTPEISALLDDVKAYAARRRGRIYAPICHPAFAGIPYEHGPERFDLIQSHIPATARTALDIGTHWGYFAHRLEQAGLKVTAVENMMEYVQFLYRIRDLYRRRTR